MIAYLFYLSAIGTILSVSLVAPALVAFGYEERDPGMLFLLYGVLGTFFFGAVLLAILGRIHELRREVSIILAVTGWVAFPVLGSVPIAHIADVAFVDALFEATSGLTTTGASVFPNVEVLPNSLVFYRAQLQWFGGLATLVTVILVLAPWQIGGLPKVGSASVAASITASPQRLAAFCGRLARVYALVTVICLGCLLLVGVAPFEASQLAFLAVSTGGFLPATESLDLLLGNGGMIILSVFLMIGATSVFWHRQLLRWQVQELKNHRESYFVLLAWFILAATIAYILMDAAGAVTILIPLSAIAEGMLNSASLIATSGIESRPGVFSLMPATLVLLVALVGAGSYSTAGGFKFFRVGVIFSLANHELNRLIHPHAIRPSHFGSVRFDDSFLLALWSLFAVFITTAGGGMFLMAVSGLSFHASFTSSIAAISNIGPLYSPAFAPPGAGAWPEYAEFTDFQKLVLSAVMVLGRLEILSAIAVVSRFATTR